jgi:L-histidine Nalpha-methyltransferase
MAQTQDVREIAENAPDDVIAGLCAPHKTLPCRLLYDARGAELFERICELDDYYLTRSELALLADHLPSIAAIVGPRARVIEPGSGAGRKTRMLLAALDQPSSYTPIDVSFEQLQHNATALRHEFPGLEIVPVHGDYTSTLELAGSHSSSRTVVFFPGSTIGNFEPRAAVEFLARFARLVGPGAVLILGTDSNHDQETLMRAYDDPEGVTAEFDLNVLAHINRTHHATFALDTFMHRAAWDAAHSRIEMHLVSRRRQTVDIGTGTISFERGEVIVTEHCYKHSHDTIRRLCKTAGWSVQSVFSDAADRMSLWIATT